MPGRWLDEIPVWCGERVATAVTRKQLKREAARGAGNEGASDPWDDDPDWIPE